MPKISQFQTSFNMGELSPNMAGRIDLNNYYHGAKTLRNVVCLPQGGVTRRTGMEVLNIVGDASRLEEFIFSGTEGYQVMFFSTRNKVEVWQDGWIVVTLNMHQSGMVQDMDVTSQGDYMILTHPDYHPMRLIRDRSSGSIVWVLEQIPLLNVPHVDGIPAWGGVSGGFPARCTFYQGRLVYGGSFAFPTRVFFSKSGLPFDFGTVNPGSIVASDGFNVSLPTGSSAITTLSSVRGLIATDSVNVYSFSDEAGVLTPEGTSAKIETSQGAALGKPASVDNMIFFISPNRDNVVSLQYDIYSKGFKSASASLLSDHIVQGGTKVAALKDGPYGNEYLALLRDNGGMSLFNSLSDQKVQNWTRIDSDNCKILDVSSFRGEFYFLTERTGIRFMEKMGKNSPCLDFSQRRTYPNEVSSITDLKPIAEDLKCMVIADGFPADAVYLARPYQGSNSSILLPFPAKDIIVGFPYTSTIETMPLNVTTKLGATINRRKRLISANVNLLNSLGVTLSHLKRQYRIQEYVVNDDATNYPDPFTGWRKVKFLGFCDEAVLKIESNGSFPFTVLAVETNVMVTEG